MPRLDTVIATVQKREQAAFDVPGMSITSIGPGSPQIVRRGISTGIAQSMPTTSIHIDEAPIGSVDAYPVAASGCPTSTRPSASSFSASTGADKAVLIPGTQTRCPDGAAKVAILNHHREI